MSDQEIFVNFVSGFELHGKRTSDGKIETKYPEHMVIDDWPKKICIAKFKTFTLEEVYIDKANEEHAVYV